MLLNALSILVNPYLELERNNVWDHKKVRLEEEK